jgi:hypothetical protein
MDADRLDVAGKVDGRESRHGPLLRPAHPIRAGAFLSLCLLCYAAASVFLYDLGSGSWFDFSPEGYQQAIAQTFGSMMLQPLSIFSHPWLILIHALLLSALIAVPLMVACLYHSRYCTLFLLCTGALGHAPLLALVLAAGCTLVAVTPLRRRNPALAVLLGMAPVWVYLVFSATHLPVALAPKQRLILGVPFLFGAFGAIVAAGVVLILAHYTRYRPGVITPVMAVLLAVPAWLFAAHVGTDEMQFALLADRLAPALESNSRRLGGQGPDKAAVEAVYRGLRHRKEAFEAACDKFLHAHPESPRAAAVLWIKGIMQDTQVCVSDLQAGWVKLYDDFPLPRSRDTWQQLASNYPSDIRAAIALYRLAHQDLRAGNAAAAADRLEAAGKILDQAAAAAAAATETGQSWWSQVFTVDPGPPATDAVQLRCDVGRLQMLISANGVLEDANSAAACAALMSLDQRQMLESEFMERINELAKRYDGTKLSDNIALARAMGKSDQVDRARLLRELEDEPGSDASIEANYELARLAMRMDSMPALARYLEKPEVYLRRVMAAVKNPWQPLAARLLANLGAPATTQP